MFGLGLAIRYLLLDNEDRIYDHAEQKEHKVSFTVGAVDQADGSEQACSSQNTDKQGPSALLSELKNASEKSMASEKVAGTSSELNCLPRKETVDGDLKKDSLTSAVNVKTKVFDRRRTVSEGHCPDDNQPSDDNLQLPGLIRVESSPPRMEHKERSLEECKLTLKQSVCRTLISCLLLPVYILRA